MLLHVLALAQGSPRFDGSTVNTVMIAVVAAGVVLVFWASRPSVISRYSARPPADEKREAETREPSP